MSLRLKTLFGLLSVLVLLSVSFAVDTECVDPANSKTVGEKDEVTCTNGTVAVDYCQGTTSVLEYHIIPTTKQLTSTLMPCKLGTVCYDGACMFPNEAKALEKEADPNIQVPASCTDSDNGQNSGVAGTMVYIFKQAGWSYGHTFKDECTGGAVLERYCDSGKGKNTTVACQEGFACAEGACVKFSPPGNTLSASGSVPASSVPADSGSTVETPVSCTDTDGGKDNKVAGSVNYAFTKGIGTYIVNLVDKCIDGNVNVSENYCGANNKAYTISSPCEAGSSCVSGACVASSALAEIPLSCKDSDGGKNPNVFGSVYYIFKSGSTNYAVNLTDKCIDGNVNVSENYCGANNKAHTISLPCETGSSCVSGACVKSSVPAPSVSASSSVPKSGSTSNNEQIIGNNVYSCVDSDGGKDDIFKAGTSIRYKNGSIDFTVQEICVSETQVMEAHCDGISPVFANPDGETCPEGYGCKSGACVNLSEPSVPQPTASATTPQTASAPSSVPQPIGPTASVTSSAITSSTLATNASKPSMVKPPTSGLTTTKPAIPSVSSAATPTLTVPPTSISSSTSGGTPSVDGEDVPSVAATAEPQPSETTAPLSGKKIANCKKSGAENIYRKDKITWTVYNGALVTPSANEDSCTTEKRLAEWVCESESSPVIKYYDCPSGSCSDGACSKSPAPSVSSSVSNVPRPIANKSVTPKSATSSTPSVSATRPRDSSVVSEETTETSSSVCRDNDGGLEYRIAGRVTCTDGRSFEDNCADSRVLVEYYERGGEMKSTRIVCSRVAEGYSCVRSACAKSDSKSDSVSVVPQSTTGASKSPKPTDVISKGIAPSVVPTVSSKVPPKAELRYECADSDGGMDIKTKGNTREALITEDGTRTESAYRDACDGDMRVREYFCSGNRAKSKTMRCSMTEKCSDGICVRSSEARSERSAASSETSASTTSRDSSTRRGNVLTTWDTSPVDELVRRR